MPDPDPKAHGVGSAEEREGGRATAKGSTERVELSRQRLGFARRVAEAKATIPHLYMSSEVGLEVSGEDDPVAAIEARLVAAAGSALTGFPDLNAARRDTAIERYSRANVGVYSSGPDGPAYLTVFDADGKPPTEIQSELAGLRSELAEGKLTSPKLSGGTFSLMVVAGPSQVAPVIQPTQVAAIAVGVPGDAERGRPRLTLATDHRLVLAEDAGRFLAEVVSGLTRSSG